MRILLVLSVPPAHAHADCVRVCVHADPGYVDESYIGTSVPAQWSQPNPNAVWLIPRMRQLIAQHFPGTKLSISEWSSTADTDVTGGLVTVDQLGVYGREGVDSATYWGHGGREGPGWARVLAVQWVRRGWLIV